MTRETKQAVSVAMVTKGFYAGGWLVGFVCFLYVQTRDLESSGTDRNAIAHVSSRWIVATHAPSVHLIGHPVAMVPNATAFRLCDSVIP